MTADTYHPLLDLRDEGGSPYTDEIVLRGHDVTRGDAREAVTGWLLDEGVCDDEDDADLWWQELAWLDRRQTYARKIPTREDRLQWQLHYPCDRGPGAFAITVVERRATVRRRLSDTARRQRIEAAARDVWPDCDPYMISGYAGGYLRADVGDVRVRVSWQEDGASCTPSLYLPRACSESLRDSIARDVAEIHRLLTEADR